MFKGGENNFLGKETEINKTESKALMDWQKKLPSAEFFQVVVVGKRRRFRIWHPERSMVSRSDKTSLMVQLPNDCVTDLQ